MVEVVWNPESIHKGAQAINDAMVDLNTEVDMPLRRAALPEMPPGVAGQVAAGIASAISMIANARSTLMSIHADLKNRTASVDDADQFAQVDMPMWAEGLHGGIWVAHATGLDLFYTVGAAATGSGSWNAVGESAAGLALTLIPFGKVAKGGKLVLGRLAGRGVEVAAADAAKSGAAVGATHAATSATRQGLDDALEGVIRQRAGGSPLEITLNDAVAGAGKGHRAGMLRQWGAAEGKALTTGGQPSQLYSALGAGGTKHAAALAALRSASTLELTELGAKFDAQKLFDSMPASYAHRIWVILSRRFAQQASGEVFANVGRHVSSSKIFASVELPVLLGNSRVTSLVIGEGGSLAHPSTIRDIHINQDLVGSADEILSIINRRHGSTIRIIFDR